MTKQIEIILDDFQLEARDSNIVLKLRANDSEISQILHEIGAEKVIEHLNSLSLTEMQIEQLKKFEL